MKVNNKKHNSMVRRNSSPFLYSLLTRTNDTINIPLVRFRIAQVKRRSQNVLRMFLSSSLSPVWPKHLYHDHH